MWNKQPNKHTAVTSLPFCPFFPRGPGGPFRPGSPLAPACPGKPLSPWIPGGPGGPGFPGKPITPVSGLRKLAASWASCSVGGGESRTMDHNMHKLTQKQLSWAAIRGSFATKHFESKHIRAQEETIQQWNENLVTSPLESLHAFPSKLPKFDRRKITLFISSNQ